MNTITIKQRGLVTLPKKLRDSLGLAEGTVLRVKTSNGNIVLEPDKKMSALDIELAAAIKQSKEDLKHGRYIEFSTIEEFHEKLAKYKK
jgi:AbrB family looped-hinge helix DNA binding protein